MHIYIYIPAKKDKGALSPSKNQNSKHYTLHPETQTLIPGTKPQNSKTETLNPKP